MVCIQEGNGMLQAKECTLHSGGHAGTETYFGECAERWGVKEVTYSFEGHFIKREKNVVMLNQNDLKRGDVSMEIISGHMHRQYAQADKMRAVFQSIFHMVNNGIQVFGVGIILADDTVTGGTGWGVELGKFFNRKVHVFDTTKEKWFVWRHGEWIEEPALITETTFCGTGTRDLGEGGRKAIEDLFARSFGPKK